MRVVIRGFADGKLKFTDPIDIAVADLDRLLPELAEKHGAALEAYDLTMIEIEFVDDPDQDARFFRIGTDPRGMVMPWAIPFGGEGNGEK